MAIKRLYGESDDTYNKRKSMTGYTYSDSEAKEAAKKAYTNRDKFNYDLGSDMNYQQAKEQYQALGKMAMNDTIGKASSLTGGYANSYATSAGQQAYNNYLTQLNENIPDYYAMALNAYEREGNELLNKYNLYNTEEQQEYSKYMDTYNNLLNLAQLENSDATTERNYEYQKARDALADEWQQKQWDYQLERDKISDSQWEKNYLLSALSNSSSSGSSSTKSSDSSLKAPTDEMYETALELYATDGENALNKYLDKLAEYDTALLNEYAQTYVRSYELPIDKVNWKAGKDGGYNWGGKNTIDNNATVINPQTGEEITLKNLKKQLEEYGYSSSEAKKYVINLQRELSLTKE